jgi:hypothetical protein
MTDLTGTTSQPRRARRWTASLVVAACVGCAPATAHEPPAAEPVAKAASAHGDMHTVAAPAATSPADVRYALEQILGHHSVLMVRLMRGLVDREDDFVSSAQVVLDRDTDQLTAAVAGAYGQPAADAFRALWVRHIDELTDYARAIGADDQAAQDQAMQQLDGYAKEYGDFIEKATSGRLPSAAVAKGVDAHIHHLLDQADAYAAKDYAKAFQLQREAYAAMFSTGKSLAGAVVSRPSGELPAGFDEAPQRLRSALGQLLGEHVELAFDATRAAVAGSPAASEGIRALDGNTRDILTALQAALGPGAATSFSRVWGSHIDALVQFTVAIAENDEAGQAAARRKIDAFPPELTKLLAGVSGGRVAAQPVVDALAQHDQQLLQQVTAYAAKDYGRAQEIAYDGYAHMFRIATTLAGALEGRAAGQAPRGGAATGGGGTASR